MPSYTLRVNNFGPRQEGALLKRRGLTLWCGIPFPLVWRMIPDRSSPVYESSPRKNVGASTGPRRKERVRGGLRLGWVLAVLGLIVGLREAGLEVPRQGKAYITAADPEGPAASGG